MYETNQKILERLRQTGRYSVKTGLALSYPDRETLKHEAWVVIGSDSPNYAKAAALLNVIEAHYWQAVEGLNSMPSSAKRRIHGSRYSKGYELDIDVYTRHWLWANGHAAALQGRGCDLLEEVQKSFGYTPEESRFLPKGCTAYRLPNKPTSKEKD